MQNKNNICNISTSHEKANYFAEQGDIIAAANQYLIAAYHYSVAHDLQSTVDCYLQCALCHVSLNNYQVAAQFYRAVAHQYQQLGDSVKAQKNLSLAKEYFEKIGYEMPDGH